MREGRKKKEKERRKRKNAQRIGGANREIKKAKACVCVTENDERANGKEKDGTKKEKHAT